MYTSQSGIELSFSYLRFYYKWRRFWRLFWKSFRIVATIVCIVSFLLYHYFEKQGNYDAKTFFYLLGGISGGLVLGYYLYRLITEGHTSYRF